MGKLAGIIKLEGTLDGLTFYKSQDGYMVRTKGGISKKRILNDPAFVRTRENIAEFGLNATAGKWIRNSIGPLLNRAKDPKLSSRMLQLMSAIKNQDTNSVRGQRMVSNGLATEAGKQLLKGLDFNNRAILGAVLHSPYSLDTATGEITIADFSTQEQLRSPDNATHVSFRTAFVALDLATGIFETCYSPVSNLVIEAGVSNVFLTPDAVPTATGNQFFYLLIEFFQEVNGVQYPLRSGAFNTLNLIEVL
jgi:hypothetical protein